MSASTTENDWETEWEAMLGTVPQIARDLREMSAPAEAGYRGLRTWIYSDRPEGSSRAVKELVMVIINVVEGNSQGAVTHMRMGIENGLTRTQLAEALAQCFLSLGLIRFNSAGIAVWRAAREMVSDQSGRGPGHPAPSHTTGHAGPHPAVRQADRERRRQP